MKHRLHRALLFCIVAALTLLCSGAAQAGNVDSPGAPTTTAGHMPSLQEMYDYLITGAVPGAAHVFQEPAAGPGSTMKSLHDIYTDSKALFDQSTVTAGDVRGSAKYFSTSPWGIQTGTMPEGTNVTGGNGLLTFSLPAGYYAGKTATATDGNLAAANIKSGVSIFGVSGNAAVVNTASATATAAYICSGKTAYVNGVLIQGVRNCPRFQDNYNGTVTDTRTGLIWLKNANLSMNWADAGTYCAGLASGTAGLTDESTAGQWRLPTVQELEGIGTDPPVTYCLDLSCNACPVTWTMPGVPFTGVQSGEYNYYWSSTTTPYSTDAAWVLHMGSGFVAGGSKTYNGYFVWPVRSGP